MQIGHRAGAAPAAAPGTTINGTRVVQHVTGIIPTIETTMLDFVWCSP